MIYLAAPFFNDTQLAFVKEIEDAFTAEGMMFFSPRSAGVLSDMSMKAKISVKRDIYLGNINSIDECDMMIAIIDDRDIGTIWEMGYATSAGKKIVSISRQGYGLNVMLAESVFAHTQSIEEAIEALKNDSFIKTDVTDVH